MKVEIINQLKDNYSFVLYNDTPKSCVIDPADSNPILNFALEKNLTIEDIFITCLLYTSPSPRDKRQSRMPSSA